MNILGDISTSGFGARLADGTHTIAANAQLLTGSLIWDSTLAASTIQGSGTETLTLAAGTSFDLIGGSIKTVDNVSINNLGVTTFNSGSFIINTPANFINGSTGIFNIAFNGNIAGTGNFTNLGTLQKTAGDGTSNISTGFTNTGGIIDIAGLNTFGLGGADLILDAGSILRGGGTFAGNVINNGGSIQPGTTFVANTLTISGNYLGSGGDVIIKLESAVNDQLIVTGSADFLNTTLILVDNGAAITDGLNLPTVISTGSLLNNLASVTNPFTGFTAANNINGNDIDLLFNLIIAGFIWTGAGDGSSWNDALNWSAGIPSAGANVSIGDFNVTITGGASANTLSLSSGGSLTLASGTFTFTPGNSSTLDGLFVLAGGTLNLTGSTLTLSGGFNWTGAGTIIGGGSGIVNILALTNWAVSGDASGVDNRILDNVTVNNSGTIVMATGLADNLSLINGATLNNQTGGLFDFQSNTDITGTGTFKNNVGSILRKSVATGSSQITAVFENDAAEISIISGVLSLDGGGSFSNALTIADGELRLGGGNYTFIDGSSINSLSGGSLRLTAATIDIPGTVTLNTLLTWAGNTTISGPGNFNISSSGILSIEGDASGVDNRILSGLTLNNSGRIIMATGLADNLVLNDGSILNNQLAGVFDFQSDTAVTNTVGGGTFRNNAGAQLIKNAGAGSAQINTVFENDDALVTINSGSFQLNGGGTFNNALTIAGGELLLNTGSYVFTDGSSINGATGNLGLQNATLSILASDTVTLNNDLRWKNSATISGPGNFIISSTGRLIIQGDASGVDNRIFDNLTMNNFGIIEMATGLADNLSLINGATLNNQTGGLFDFQSNTDITGTGTFKNNVGSILRKSVATGSSQITAVFENDAAEISIISGVLSLDGGGSFSNALTIADGELRLGGGNYTFIDGSSINSLSGGSLRLTAATIDIPGTVTLNTLLTWAGNTTISGPGNFNISSSGILSIEGDASGVDNRILSGLTLNNSGRIIMATGLADNLVLNDGSILNNQLAGVFDFQSDTAVTNTVGGGTFRNNAGAQLIKNAGAGSAQINTVFENDDALVTINSGSFQLNGGGTFNNALTIAGGELLLNTGSYVFTDGSSINGATGNLGLQNATLSILASDTVTLNNDLRWKNSATISGPGNFIISSTGRLIIQGDASGVDNRIFDNLTMNNFGIIEMATGLADNLTLINGATLNNQTGGLFDFQSDADVTGTGSFNNNAGSTLIKSAVTGTSTISATFTQTGSSVDIVTGSLSLNGAPLILDAASVLQGSGTFIGNVDNLAGTVRPGGVGATDILTIDGDYTQGVNGLLQIELQGTTVGTQYDQLAVTGNIIAEGVIAISDTGFLSPSVSDNFIVMTSGGSISGNNKIIFPLGYAFPNKAASQYDITFQNNNTVFFDNFAGDLDWNNANNWSSGLLPGSGVDIDTASLTTGGTILISDGTFDINNLTSNSNINNTGANFTVAGNVTVADNFVYTQDGVSAFTQFDGAFNNTAAAGVLIDNNQGNIIINGTAIAEVTNNGVLSGSGTVVGNVSNGGNFNPGNSPGTFTIDGDLNLLDSSILNIDIAGLVQGDDYDVLIVTGSVNFAGQLNVIIDNSAGYTGNLDDSFSPISFASGSGNLSVTASRGYAYDLTINSNNLNLLTTQVPGLFVPNVQSDIVTLIGSTLNISSFESADDIEADLQRSKDEDEDEKDNVLICS